jgi:hypothetical protein
LEADQLYNLASDPSEQTNLAGKPEFKDRLKTMQKMLAVELKRFPDRPFGEFVPGGNAAPLGAAENLLNVLRKAARAQ